MVDGLLGGGREVLLGKRHGVCVFVLWGESGGKEECLVLCWRLKGELWKSEEKEREKGKKNPRILQFFYRQELSEVHLSLEIKKRR